MIQNIDRQVCRQIDRAIAIVNFDSTNVRITEVRFVGDCTDDVTRPDIVLSTDFNAIGLHWTMFATATFAAIFFPVRLARLQSVQHQRLLALS